MRNTNTNATILVVDDEPLFCRQSRVYLESEGFEVHTESNGRNVLEALGSKQPDLIILDLDLGLPDIDGRIICNQLTQTERYREGKLGIILISGQYKDQRDELIGYSVGADNYLTKPFSMAQLSARATAILRRLNKLENTQLTVGDDFSIDTRKQEVRISGEEISLSRLEYNLLEHLVLAQGGVCMKSDLLRHVWENMHIEEGAIAKCISLLRSKLSPDSPQRYIATVYGVGYKFLLEQGK